MFSDNSLFRNFFKAGKGDANKPSFFQSFVTKKDFRKTGQSYGQPQFLNFGSSIQSKDSNRGFYKKSARGVSNQEDAFSLLNLGEKSSINYNARNTKKDEPVYIMATEYHCNMIHQPPTQIISVEAVKPSSIMLKNNQQRNRQPFGHLSQNDNSIKRQNDSDLHKIMTPSKHSTHFQSKIDSRVNQMNSNNMRNNRKQPTIVITKPIGEDQIQNEQRYNVFKRISIPRKIVCPDQAEYQKMVDQLKSYKNKKIEESKKNANINKFR